MKATGIIRRVDDLGRIVIAKYIRRELNIGEGEPMEFFIDGESIVIRKYKPYEVDNCENETYNCDACVKKRRMYSSNFCSYGEMKKGGAE